MFLFFVALGQAMFNDGHLQKISLFDIVIRECMGPWNIRSFKYSSIEPRTANQSLVAGMNAGPNYR